VAVGAAGGGFGGGGFATGTAEGAGFPPAQSYQAGAEDQAVGADDEHEEEAADFEDEGWNGGDAGFAFGRDALEVAGEQDGVFAFGAFGGRAGVGAQVGKGFSAVPASDGENIAAQSQQRLAASWRAFNTSSWRWLGSGEAFLV
jgi:hypothetical protein